MPAALRRGSGPRPGGTAARSAPVSHVGAGVEPPAASLGTGTADMDMDMDTATGTATVMATTRITPTGEAGGTRGGAMAGTEVVGTAIGPPTAIRLTRMYGDGGYGASAEEPARHDPAIIETKVSPSNATVVLDGEDVGFASDYNGRWDRLSVKPEALHRVSREGPSIAHGRDRRVSGRGVRLERHARRRRGRGHEDRGAHPAPEARPEPPPMSRPAATGRLRINAEPGTRRSTSTASISASSRALPHPRRARGSHRDPSIGSGAAWLPRRSRRSRSGRPISRWSSSGSEAAR